MITALVIAGYIAIGISIVTAIHWFVSEEAKQDDDFITGTIGIAIFWGVILIIAVPVFTGWFLLVYTPRLIVKRAKYPKTLTAQQQVPKSMPDWREGDE